MEDAAGYVAAKRINDQKKVVRSIRKQVDEIKVFFENIIIN